MVILVANLSVFMNMRGFLMILLFFPLSLFAQFTRSMVGDIRSLQMVLNDDWSNPAVLTLGSDDEIVFSFDEMSHTYNRYTYRIVHCNSDWTPSELFEIDYLDGFNNRPIEDWSNSENTTQLYTHYEFVIPNESVGLKVSGNYKVEIYDDDSSVDEPVAMFGFCVLDRRVGIDVQVSGNTEVDLNDKHQQVSFEIDYAGLNVSDPANDIKVVVVQNGRLDNRVSGIKPTYITSNKLQYVYKKELVFEAGNEYRRFELTDPYSPGMNVERVAFSDPYYNAELYIDKAGKSYRNYYDENGRFFVNTLEGYGTDLEADYALVHFCLDAPYRSGGQYYLSGDAWGNRFADSNIMQYDAARGVYTATQLLKFGVYNYSYLWLPDGSERALTEFSEGNFYNTENEYTVYVYHRDFGARYDTLIGMQRVKYS